MTAFPIIGRELRSAARHSFSYNLRVLSVGALLLASVIFGMDHGFSSNAGGALFGSLHFTLFISIWILVPLLSADCISRERREGTLGLLFLTPLNANGVVIAKGLVHGLRALTLWIAVLPVLTLPVLMGGVSWTQGLISFMINLSAIFWALAAGILASAWSKTWLRSLLAAAILAVLFFLFMGLIAGHFLAPIFTRQRYYFASYAGNIYSLVAGLGFVTNSLGTWPVYLRLARNFSVIRPVAGLMVVSFGVLIVAILLAAQRIRRVWQEEPPSARQIWWRNTFCTPVLWVSLLRRWMQWKLQHNPIGWLEQRTWTGRLVTWGWFAVIVSLYSAALTDSNFFRSYSAMHRVVSLFLAMTIAASAAGSFQRERETGVLELLLVSPVGEGAIIAGRVRGLWGQFLPTIVLLLGVWLYFGSILPHEHDGQAILFYAATFASLPVIGLYFSLRCRNFISAFLWTLAFGMLLPILLPPVFGMVGWLLDSSDLQAQEWNARLSFWAGCWQLVIAAICWPLLYRRLRRRSFAIGKGDGSI